jgi:hypothetical protein
MPAPDNQAGCIVGLSRLADRRLRAGPTGSPNDRRRLVLSTWTGERVYARGFTTIWLLIFGGVQL